MEKQNSTKEKNSTSTHHTNNTSKKRVQHKQTRNKEKQEEMQSLTSIDVQKSDDEKNPTIEEKKTVRKSTQKKRTAIKKESGEKRKSTKTVASHITEKAQEEVGTIPTDEAEKSAEKAQEEVGTIPTDEAEKSAEKPTEKVQEEVGTIPTDEAEKSAEKPVQEEVSVIPTADASISPLFTPVNDREDSTVTANNDTQENNIQEQEQKENRESNEAIEQTKEVHEFSPMKKHPATVVLEEGRLRKKTRQSLLMRFFSIFRINSLFRLLKKKQKQTSDTEQDIAIQQSTEKVASEFDEIQTPTQTIRKGQESTDSISTGTSSDMSPDLSKGHTVQTIFAQESLDQYNESHAMHTLHVQELHKYFGKKRAVQGVSFSVSTGEVVGFLGPNGAGKTTVFYMIVGFIIPTKGSIVLDGNVINKLAMHKRAKLGISYLPQDPSVFRRMSVEKNILAILETIPGLKRQERMERLESIMRDFGLLSLRKQKAYTLSGGERRRTEIARAMALKPRFLLLDEPFTGIDPKARYELKQIIAALAKRGVGVLITDHNEHDTLSITNRAFIIHNGKIMVTGSREEIMNDVRAREIYLGEHYGT